MAGGFPQAVLFCCDHNAVRSPMAEGLMKALHGQRAYVQSAGVANDMEIDGFSIAVCRELGIELSRHRSRSFQEMQDWGDALGQFDLIVALSPASMALAQELTRHAHVELVHWPISDPTAGGAGPSGQGREDRLAAYRRTRDEIHARLLAHFGPPSVASAPPQP